jgi:hypothetical protein
MTLAFLLFFVLAGAIAFFTFASAFVTLDLLFALARLAGDDFVLLFLVVTAI